MKKPFLPNSDPFIKMPYVKWKSPFYWHFYGFKVSGWTLLRTLNLIILTKRQFSIKTKDAKNLNRLYPLKEVLYCLTSVKKTKFICFFYKIEGSASSALRQNRTAKIAPNGKLKQVQLSCLEWHSWTSFFMSKGHIFKTELHLLKAKQQIFFLPYCEGLQLALAD